MAGRDLVLVTGGNGFIGSALTRALLDDGYQVAVLVEPGSNTSELDRLPVRQTVGDVRSPESVRIAMEGCRAVFHTAALYRFWAPDHRLFYEVNVDGTRNVLAAAIEAGVEKVVYTSTVGTIGLDRASAGRPADETCYPDVGHLFGSYKRSKYVAEHEVLRAGAEGCPVSLVMPTFPLGPGDRAPTPTGRVVVEYLNGRIPVYVDTVLNPVHVDDVARGHILALEKGRPGRSYILGGENMTMERFLAELARCTGLPAVRVRVPRAVSLSAAWLSDTIEGRLLRRNPAIPLEAARMSTTRMAFDDTRAREELGYTSRPAAQAIADSARWFVEHGYVTAARRSKIRWNLMS